jgi:hypothetical protein
MGKHSKDKWRIVVNCNPVTYDKFYSIKMLWSRAVYNRRSMDNEDFITDLLKLAEEKIIEVRKRKVLGYH